MKKVSCVMTLVLTLAALALEAMPARAAGPFELVTGKAFDAGLPKDFYLEGNAIPTEKRNAAMLKTASGARLLVGLLDTSGYSSQVQQKYMGMLITETRVSVCGHPVGIGSYGLGLKHPTGESAAPGQFFVYDQAGKRVAECSAAHDSKLQNPRPLQAVTDAAGAKVYFGRYEIEIKP